MTSIIALDRSAKGGRAEPDAHGQAALLLAESTLHLLVETRVISNAGARGVVRSACEVKIEVAEATGESDRRMHESLALLDKIGASFAADGRAGEPRD